MGHFLNLFSLILLILISNHFFFLIVGSIFVHSNFFSGLFSKRRNTVNFREAQKSVGNKSKILNFFYINGEQIFCIKLVAIIYIVWKYSFCVGFF